MKAWHVVVMDMSITPDGPNKGKSRCKTVSDKEMFSAAESRTLFDTMKKEFAETHPHYIVSRDQY